MSIITFLSPEKFPNLRGASKAASAAITIKEDRIGINVTLFKQLNDFLPGFKNLHLIEEESADDEKKTVFKSFIIPCNDEKAWKIKLNKKNSSCSFTSKMLCEKLKEKWAINDLMILHKIPISETAETVKDYKGFQIQISNMEAIIK